MADTAIKHILTSQQFQREDLEEIFALTKEMEELIRTREYSYVLKGKHVFNLFYQPSTRTRVSFEIAAMRLGAQVTFTENARQFSSAAKGESLEHTIRVLCGYGYDCIILRYDANGGAERAATISTVPIINAGDGKGQHPTQALIDLYSIKKAKGTIDNLSIAIVGDLTGRAARSLSYMLSRYELKEIFFVSPKILKIGDDIKDYLTRHKVKFTELYSLEQVILKADVIYQMRIQAEYLKSPFDFWKRIYLYAIYNRFIINKVVVSFMKRDAILLHPLPIRDEITPDVDNDPHARYFDQATNGLPLRMALLKMLLT